MRYTYRPTREELVKMSATTLDNYQALPTLQVGDLEVYRFTFDSRRGQGRLWGGIAFVGKSQKPIWHLHFRDEAALDRKIMESMAGRRAHRRRLGARKVERAQFSPVKVGDLFYTSWGYDQTNVDFYQVVRVSATGATCDVREVGGHTVHEGKGSDRVSPLPGQFVGPVIKGLRISGSGGKPHLTIKGHSAWPTSAGESHYQTSSGWGQ